MSRFVHVLGHLTNQLGTVLGAGGFCHDCFVVDGASSTVCDWKENLTRRLASRVCTDNSEAGYL